MDRSALQENLERLRASVRRCALRQGFAAPSPAHSETARIISTALPLSTGTSASNFAQIVENGSLLCQSRLPSKNVSGQEPTHEAILGTADFVFFFAAPFRYPTTECGFLFKRELEENHRDSGVASPFDSGALIKVFKVSDPVTFLTEHEVPIPAHRELLRESMEQLFDDPWHYLEGLDPRSASHFGLTGGDSRRYTHEVRIRDAVSVKHHLEAVFLVRGRAADPRIEKYLEWCEDNVVFYEVIPTPRGGSFNALQRACLQYVRDRLEA